MPRTIIVLLMIMLTVISGCGFKDVDKRLFVVAMGIDQAGEHGQLLRISLKVAIPQGDPKSGQQQFEIVTVESTTIAEALRRAKSKVDRELEYGHTKVILLGELAAKNRLKHITDWAIRRRDFQMIALMAIGKPTALDVLKAKPQTERVPANALILSLTKDGTESPFISTQYLFDTQRRITEFGIDPYLPIVQAKKNRYQIDTVALFNQESEQTLLDAQESRIFNMLQPGSVKTNLTIQSKSNIYDLNIDRTSASYSIVLHPSRPTIRYALKLYGSLEELVKDERITPAKLHAIEKLGEEQLNRQTEALLEKMQRSNVDPLGFGLRYSARSWNNQTEMKQWEQSYAAVKFEVKSSIRLKFSGVIE